MIPQSYFDILLCQKVLDISPQVKVVDLWSVDEHDPLAVQPKLAGRFDSEGPLIPMAIPDSQTRTTGAIYELQLQSLESENRSYRLSSLPWFSQIATTLSH